MANKLLLRTLAKFSDQIKSGTAKVQDIITDYFNTTGKSVTEEERAIILNEFAKDAPSNVTTLEGVDAVETIMPMGGVRGPNVQKAGEMSDTPVTDKIMKDRGVELRGDESFGEILEKFKTKEEGIGSLFPKDIDGFDDRREVAEFVKKMRGAGIKNPDIRGVFKEFGTDIEGGKRAATTLARAADMGADTTRKQELLSELDEMKMDEGPRFFQEEYMGYDSFGAAMDAKKIEVNNAIADDLEKRGVDDDVITTIMGRAREINQKPFYTSGEEFIDIIKEELEFEKIGYDLEFYKKYFRELESLMRKPESRFMYGGVV